MSASSWAVGLQDLGLGMGVWGMVRGLTAMWELKASKVSSSVIVTVWLAQIGRAAVSTWLPCSSLHHGTEQPCTSAPTHQTHSGTHTVLGFSPIRTWLRFVWWESKNSFDYNKCWCNSIKQIFKIVQRLEMLGLFIAVKLGKSTPVNKPSIQASQTTKSKTKQ